MREEASPAALETQFSVEQFYYREARLLDERRFKAWVGLFTDDARYFVPTRSNRSRRDAAHEISPPGAVSHYDDDKPTLLARVARLESGLAWADEPASRTRHLISNVEILHEAVGSGELEVLSAFLVYRSRGEHDQTTFAGQRTDRLRRAGGAFQIARRTVILDQSVILSNALNALF
jgi:3-phenylpropionate/cinnamic acid dioxygenase small subunit